MTLEKGLRFNLQHTSSYSMDPSAKRLELDARAILVTNLAGFISKTLPDLVVGEQAEPQCSASCKTRMSSLPKLETAQMKKADSRTSGPRLLERLAPSHIP